MIKTSLSGPIDTYPLEIQSVCAGLSSLLLSKSSFFFLHLQILKQYGSSFQGCFLVLCGWLVWFFYTHEGTNYLFFLKLRFL